MTSNSVYETVYSSRSMYMMYMTHTLASGARDRGFESTEQDVRMPHCTWMYVSTARIARIKY
jgi:hypothetical protein